MKIEKTDLKMVNIHNGDIVTPSHVRTFTPFGDTAEKRQFYRGARLTKAGLPPKNGANYSWESEAHWQQNKWNPEAERRGHIAVLDAEREEWANKARARVAELEAELERAEDALHAIYAGPKPETLKP